MQVSLKFEANIRIFCFAKSQITHFEPESNPKTVLTGEKMQDAVQVAYYSNCLFTKTISEYFARVIRSHSVVTSKETY